MEGDQDDPYKKIKELEEKISSLESENAKALQEKDKKIQELQEQKNEKNKSKTSSLSPKTITNNKEIVISLQLFGASNVGRSTLINSFISGKYNDKLPLIIDFEYKEKIVTIDNKQIKVLLYDYNGGEKMLQLQKEKDCFMLVYDITNKKSFEENLVWDLKTLTRNFPENKAIIIVGNKNDLEGERKIDFNQGKQLADDNGLLFMETSAKNFFNVEESFMSVITRGYQRKMENLNNNNNYCCIY